MQWTDRIKQVKVALVLGAVLIAGASLVVSHTLISDLSREERERMEVWAEAMRSLINADGTTDLNLVLKVINGNNTIPVIVQDARGTILEQRNLRIPANADSLAFLETSVRRMREAGNVMKMNLATAADAGGEDCIYICYEESVMLRRLASYPYVQLGVVGLFVVMALLALLSSKRAEQNRVWVGLSRETAHQLGTPISSLMAWSHVLRESYPDDPLLPEMEKDVRRLELIAERFSKIGSVPELKPENLCDIIGRVVDYIGHRTSDKVMLTCSVPSSTVMVRMCAPLFEWVVENLCKNAIDAMSGEGKICIYVYRSADRIVTEVSDTGKGIPRRDFKNVFKPGFTTKRRGWGLGLSLAKRIVEDYHRGRIYVKSSEPGKGTTFCIELRAGEGA